MKPKKSINKKVERFTELCFISRKEGISEELHLEKKRLANEMVDEGLMIYNGQYNFVNKEDINFFEEMISNLCIY